MGKTISVSCGTWTTHWRQVREGRGWLPSSWPAAARRTRPAVAGWALQHHELATHLLKPTQEVWDAKEGYCRGIDAGGGSTRVESFSQGGGGKGGGK